MESNKKLLVVILLAFLSLLSCSTSEYKQSRTIFYPNGSIKSIKYWNIEAKDELRVLFSESGDTLELTRIIYPHMGIAKYSEDTIEYRFYVAGEDNKWYINEHLTSYKNISIPSKSKFVYLIKDIDSIRFSFIGVEPYKFSIVLYKSDDEIGSFGDTITSTNNRSISLSNKQLINHKAEALIDFKHDVDSNSFLRILSIVLHDHEKIEFQRLFNISDPEKY